MTFFHRESFNVVSDIFDKTLMTRAANQYLPPKFIQQATTKKATSLVDSIVYGCNFQAKASTKLINEDQEIIKKPTMLQIKSVTRANPKAKQNRKTSFLISEKKNHRTKEGFYSESSSRKNIRTQNSALNLRSSFNHISSLPGNQGKQTGFSAHSNQKQIFIPLESNQDLERGLNSDSDEDEFKITLEIQQILKKQKAEQELRSMKFTTYKKFEIEEDSADPNDGTVKKQANPKQKKGKQISKRPFITTDFDGTGIVQVKVDSSKIPQHYYEMEYGLPSDLNENWARSNKTKEPLQVKEKENEQIHDNEKQAVQFEEEQFLKFFSKKISEISLLAEVEEKQEKAITIMGPRKQPTKVSFSAFQNAKKNNFKDKSLEKRRNYFNEHNQSRTSIIRTPEKKKKEDEKVNKQNVNRFREEKENSCSNNGVKITSWAALNFLLSEKNSEKKYQLKKKVKINC